MSSRSNFEKLRLAPHFSPALLCLVFMALGAQVHLKSHRKSITSGPVLVARLKFLGEITI